MIPIETIESSNKRYIAFGTFDGRLVQMVLFALDEDEARAFSKQMDSGFTVPGLPSDYPGTFGQGEGHEAGPCDVAFDPPVRLRSELKSRSVVTLVCCIVCSLGKRPVECPINDAFDVALRHVSV